MLVSSHYKVSIPSRRVGDDWRPPLKPSGAPLFPSPQGGSETYYKRRGWRFIYFVSIPSRRVGDLCVNWAHLGRVRVSIPSRRVGDNWNESAPLKSSKVSIPSRRVGDLKGKFLLNDCVPGFHPLKAGRRLTNHLL